MKRRRTGRTSSVNTRHNLSDRVPVFRNRSVALRRAKQAQSFGEELKVHDIELVNTNVTITGTVWHLSDVSLGDANTERIGKKITMKYAYLRIHWKLPSVSPDSSNTCRVIIIRWNVKGTPTVADILYNVATTGPAAMLSQINASNFQVLADQTLSLSLTGEQAKPMTIYIPLKNQIAGWESSQGNRDRGHVYAVLISDSAAQGHPYINATSRVRYLG